MLQMSPQMAPSLRRASCDRHDVRARDSLPTVDSFTSASSELAGGERSPLPAFLCKRRAPRPGFGKCSAGLAAAVRHLSSCCECCTFVDVPLSPEITVGVVSTKGTAVAEAVPAVSVPLGPRAASLCLPRAYSAFLLWPWGFPAAAPQWESAWSFEGTRGGEAASQCTPALSCWLSGPLLTRLLKTCLFVSVTFVRALDSTKDWWGLMFQGSRLPLN